MPSVGHPEGRVRAFDRQNLANGEQSPAPARSHASAWSRSFPRFRVGTPLPPLVPTLPRGNASSDALRPLEDAKRANQGRDGFARQPRRGKREGREASKTLVPTRKRGNERGSVGTRANSQPPMATRVAFTHPEGDDFGRKFLSQCLTGIPAEATVTTVLAVGLPAWARHGRRAAMHNRRAVSMARVGVVGAPAMAASRATDRGSFLMENPAFAPDPVARRFPLSILVRSGR